MRRRQGLAWPGISLASISSALRSPRKRLSVLRKAGLVDVERDALDARWVYYSINRQALAELNAAFGTLLDPARIKPRRATCGPQGAFVRAGEILVAQN